MDDETVRKLEFEIGRLQGMVLELQAHVMAVTALAVVVISRQLGEDPEEGGRRIMRSKEETLQALREDFERGGKRSG